MTTNKIISVKKTTEKIADDPISNSQIADSDWCFISAAWGSERRKEKGER